MAFPTDSSYVKYLGGGYHLVAENAPDLSLTWDSAKGIYSVQVGRDAAIALSGLCAVVAISPLGVLNVVPASVTMVNYQAGVVMATNLCGQHTSSSMSLSGSTVLRLVPNE